MTSLHAPFTRRGKAMRTAPEPRPDETRPVADQMLEALIAGERALTRTAQDERDIAALQTMRAAINRARQ